MIECYFTNLEDIVIGELKKANKSILVAVAWINFKHYGQVFEELINRQVKIKIVLNDDDINQRNMIYIDELKSKGIKIKLVKSLGIMHHKFCIIDKSVCVFGSFNWTNSANSRNIEDVNICDEKEFVTKYLKEFKSIWKLSKDDLILLANPEKCPCCNGEIIYILSMEKENDFQTKVQVLQKCECGGKIVSTDYYGVELYYKYEDLCYGYEDFCQKYDLNEVEEEEIYYYYKDQIESYLAFVRNNRFGVKIIHAVAILDYEIIDPHSGDGELVYKIIWKERGMESYIEKEYPIHYFI